MPAHSTTAPQATKPRIALMGEFSAGKSTLANLLLEQQHSPVQVTATQLPPVWYSHGDPAAHRVTLDGRREPITEEDWSSTTPADTQLIQVALPAEILESADLIDLPGTADPNLPIQYWETLIPQVDIAVWCTPSNQAWRQSEAALWDCAPPELQERSLLLVTRMDKIRADIDKARILQRVVNEAGGLFREVLPVSLTDALAAPDSDAAMEKSGAADMIRFLIQSLDALGPTNRPDYVPHLPKMSNDEDASTAAPVQPYPSLIQPRRIGRRRDSAMDPRLA